MNTKDKQIIVDKIRNKYVEREATDLDALRALDRSTSRPANIFSYSFGSLSAIIMGSGMSLIMTDLAEKIGISNPMPLGVVIGVLGLGMAIINYPIHKWLLGRARKKNKEKILALSEKITDTEK